VMLRPSGKNSHLTLNGARGPEPSISIVVSAYLKWKKFENVHFALGSSPGKFKSKMSSRLFSKKTNKFFVFLLGVLSRQKQPNLFGRFLEELTARQFAFESSRSLYSVPTTC
jgi:hypothetical protein